MEKVKNRSYLLVWMVFFVYLLLQHSFVWMYIDDYGYASLNYAVNVGTTGNNYGILDIFLYLYKHYTQWGGRVFFYGIAILIYHFGGLTGMRVFQSVVIFLIFYMVFKISCKNMDSINKIILSIAVCLLYGFFQIELVNCGLYWFSASSGYVWPILVLFSASSYLQNMYTSNEDGSNQGLHKLIICSILWFFSAFSQEQIAIASIVICFMQVVYGKYVKKYRKVIYLIAPLISVVLGATIMLLAPGNFGRLEETSNMSIFQQIRCNIPYLLGYIYSSSTKLFLSSVFVCFIFVTVSIVKSSTQKITKLLLKILFLFQIVILSIMLVLDQDFINEKLLVIGVVTVIILISVILVSYYLIINNNIWQFFCLSGAIVCYAAMVAVPAIPIRVYIPFMILSLPAIVCIYKDNIRNIFAYFLLVPLSLLMLFNMVDIYNGYRLNNSLQKANWEAVSSYHETETDIIELQKMYIDLYTAPLSYMDGYTWADSLMCKYFDVPEENVTFIWNESYYIDAVHVYDENEQYVFAIVPNFYMGNEEVFVDGELIDVIYGDTFISFAIDKDMVQTNTIKVVVCSPIDKMEPIKTIISIP